VLQGKEKQQRAQQRRSREFEEESNNRASGCIERSIRNRNRHVRSSIVTHPNRSTPDYLGVKQMLRRRDPLVDPEPLIRRVYNYAAYRLGDGADAEDATSETLERALRYRLSYDPRTGSAQAWLLGIARRVVDDRLSRSPIAASYGLDAEVAGDDELASETIERLSLRSALAELSQDERDLLAMRYGADLTAGDISRITGTRTNTIEVALHRTLAKLRRRMDARSLTHETSA
jgi:RNA polymerase sigma factor (sigma-70 family)